MEPFLPVGSSVQEIESEKTFYSVLLETLDPESPDYFEQKQKNEEALAKLDAMMQDHHGLQVSSYHTPYSRVVHPSHDPPGYSLKGQTDGSSSPRDTFGSLAGLNAYGKRLRSPQQMQQNHKRSRGSFSSDQDSIDSSSSLERNAQKTNFLERIKDQHRAIEARFKQEQADAELARSLVQEQPNARSSSQSMNQTQIGNSGDMVRPQIPFGTPDPSPFASSPFAFIPRLGSFKQEHPRLSIRTDESSNASTPNRIPRPIKTEHSTSAQSLQRPHASNEGVWNFSGFGQGPSGRDSDTLDDSTGSFEDSDDCAIISPAQFVPNSRRLQQSSHLHSTSLNSSHLSPRYPPYPVNVTSSSAASRSAPPSALTPSTRMPGNFPGYSSAAYPQNLRHNRGESSSSWTRSLGGVDLMGRALNAGKSLMGSILPPSLEHRLFDFDRTSPNLDDLDRRVCERGLGAMLTDPAHTKEDLLKLLENIRPDEEIPEPMRGEAPAELSVPLMRHQVSGLEWLKKQEESTAKGSILADDMGLGKTIQAIALILARKSGDPTNKTTLVVTPVALLRQWAREIEKKIVSRHALKVLIYHGVTKSRYSYAHLKKYDVVLTTFGTLSSEFKRKQKYDYYCKKNGDPPRRLQEKFNFYGDGCKFWRIIIDEAQNIKNKSTKAAKGACNIEAEYRLCMTGTPMMNNILELYSLVRFLRISPYNDESKFKRDFVLRLRSGSEDERTRGMRAFQAFLKAILLRRLKSSKQDGKPILELPPRTTEVTHAVFDDEQAAFYKALHERSVLQMNRYIQAGTVMKNYSNALVLLLRLRQACCHPHLIKDHVAIDGEENKDEMEALAQQLDEAVVNMVKSADGCFECPICYDATEEPRIFFPCGHDTCAECFGRMIESATNSGEGNAKCPECRAQVDPGKVISYNTFLKVHLPEKYKERFPEANCENDDAQKNDDDEESESEAISSDSDNSQGNLDGFIVADDEVEYEGESDSESIGKVLVEKKSSKSNVKVKKEEHIKSAKRKGKGKAVDGRIKKTLAQLKKESSRNKKSKRQYLKRLRREYVPSAKLLKTIEILHNIKETDHREKVIIFSQFTSLLDLMEIPISEEGWRYERYDGSMNAEMRNDAVCNFAENPDVTIMLVSLKAGNAGLNLNCASQVIILDPFWNPFIEEQAIDRAHRIGQLKPVFVHRILITNTVEDRIIALQEKKRSLINEALDEKAGQSVSRLGVRELAYLFGITNEV